MQMRVNTTNGPRKGTPNTSHPKVAITTISVVRIRMRESRYDARYSARDMGDAISRFSSLRRRASTMLNPMPHIPSPIMFMPSRPGSRKSM